MAIGEAGLAGAPIVCTDVGATFQVVTDPDDDTKRFGAVVAPNDPRSLARAQISMLALMDEWAEFAQDTVRFEPMPDNPTSEDVERITRRMYENHEQRRVVGAQLRGIVQKSFSGDRYLREHEQMLWVGKYLHDAQHERIARERRLTTIEVPFDDMDDPENPWQAYRPDFWRSIRGFSAFESVSGVNRSTFSEDTFSRAPSMVSEYHVKQLKILQSPIPSEMSFDGDDDPVGEKETSEVKLYL